MKRLFDKYREDLQGLLWLFLGIFIGVSLISYSPHDPSLNAIVQNTKPHNLCGYLGSFLSDLLYQAFGVSAWVLVVGPLRQAAHSFEHGHIRFPRAVLLDTLPASDPDRTVGGRERA